MSTSDIIQIISIILSFVLSTIAITISILTLKQNNKMIFESNKPYITIFTKVISFTSPNMYLILKNFGNSGAIILSIDYDLELDFFFNRKPFKNITNTFIAPGQTFAHPFSLNKEIEPSTNFKITYSYLNKIYVENIYIHFKHHKDICHLKCHSSKDLQEISDILQEMTIQNL